MLNRLQTTSQIRWISEDVNFVAVAFGANDLPIEAGGVAVYDVARLGKGQSGFAAPKLPEKQLVHLVFGQPKAQGGHFVGKVVEFDAVKIPQRDVRQGQSAQLAEDVHFEAAEFFVGNDEKISRATRWVKDFDVLEARQQGVEAFGVATGGGQFGAEFVQNNGSITFMMLGTEV